MIVEELYDALKEAGASEDKARSAARALAGFEGRFACVSTDLSVLKWGAGLNLAVTALLLFKTFL